LRSPLAALFVGLAVAVASPYALGQDASPQLAPVRPAASTTTTPQAGKPTEGAQNPPGPGASLGREAEPGFSQIRTNVVIDASPAVFTMLAALNVAGYSDGMDAPNASPLRREIRDRLLALNLPIYGELRMFYRQHYKANPEQNIAQYISLALFLQDPPDLKFDIQPRDMPPDAAGVADFVPLLRRFYRDANLDQVWLHYRPIYEAAIDSYAGRVRDVTSRVDYFFRRPEQFLGYQVFIIPEVLTSPLQTHARDYRGNYFIVVSLDADRQMSSIQHTYLHYVLDGLIAAYPGAVDQIRPLMAVVQRAPALDPQFKNDANLFFTECLVRAVEIQLEKGSELDRQRQVDADVAQGFVLVRFFHQQLLLYKKDYASFREFYPEAVYSMDVHAEVNRARKVAFAAAPTQPRQAEPEKVVGLLDVGEARLHSGDLDGTITLAQQALTEPLGDHAAAYYLLALVATERGKPDEARHDFEQALTSAPLTEAHVRTWSNIYLGRILDLEQQRDQALTHYRAALATADTPVARMIAEDGIKRQFTTGKTHDR
jgi:tetratricopeptide (TPR) repeat protein